METIRVTCNCEHCADYARRKGVAFPMAADVNVKMAAGCGITERNANRPAKTHRLVAVAHTPEGATQAKHGPWAA